MITHKNLYPIVDLPSIAAFTDAENTEPIDINHFLSFF
jgi:hypothetical protein